MLTASGHRLGPRVIAVHREETIHLHKLINRLTHTLTRMQQTSA